MDVLLFLAITIFLAVFPVFFPDIFPRCSLCRKLKPRFLFRIRVNRGILPGYARSKSVCRKCCRKYGIDSLKQAERVRQIRRRIETEAPDMLKKTKNVNF
jgi:hypothetical protein